MFSVFVNNSCFVVSDTGNVLFRQDEVNTDIQILEPLDGFGAFPVVVASPRRALILKETGRLIDIKEFKETEPGDVLDGFSNGLLACRHKNAKWGYVDSCGEWVIAPQFTRTYPFCDGMALVQLRPECVAVIDLSGRTIKQFPRMLIETSTTMASKLDPLHFGALVQKSNRWQPHVVRNLSQIIHLRGAIDIAYSGREVTICRILDKGKIKFQLRNDRGEILSDKMTYLSEPSEGLLAYLEVGKKYFGLFNLQGEQMIPPVLHQPIQFIQGWACCSAPMTQVVDRNMKTVMSAQCGLFVRCSGGIKWQDATVQAQEALCINHRGAIIWSFTKSSPENIVKFCDSRKASMLQLVPHFRTGSSKAGKGDSQNPERFV